MPGKPPRIPDDTLITLRDKGLSIQAIAAATSMPAANVWERLKKLGYASLDAATKVKDKAELLDLLQLRILDSITPDVIEKSSLLQRVTAAGILYDKGRLERGLSTANLAIDGTLEVLQRRAMHNRGEANAIDVTPTPTPEEAKAKRVERAKAANAIMLANKAARAAGGTRFKREVE